MSEAAPGSLALRATAGVISRYREWLPLADDAPVVSLGEGSTPLVLAERLSDELDQALEAPLAEEEDEQQPLEPISEEHEQPAPRAEQPVEEAEPKTDYDPDTGHEDVLEDTPDFLEDAPEDDELWFEQKPPKDFDFDD